MYRVYLLDQTVDNPILGKVPGADGLKTGHTDEAGYGFTGSAEQNGRRLIEVVAGLDSWNARVQESTRLIQWGFNAWQAKPLFQQGAKVGTAQVQMGSSNAVSLVAPRDLAATVPAGLSSGSIQTKIRYNGPLVAPIAKGQEVAQLVLTTGDTPPRATASRSDGSGSTWDEGEDSSTTRQTREMVLFAQTTVTVNSLVPKIVWLVFTMVLKTNMASLTALVLPMHLAVTVNELVSLVFQFKSATFTLELVVST